MGDWISFLVLGLVFILIFLGVTWYKNKQGIFSIKDKSGNSKSGKVAAFAKKFARENGYHCISPALITRDGKQADLDAVVIGTFGILAVKELAYSGEIYATDPQKDWLQITETGKRNYIGNPVMEASADVRVIRDVLFEIKIRQVPVEVICVFSDKKAELAINKKIEYFTLASFKNLLKKDKYIENKNIDKDKIYSALQNSCK